MVSTSQSVAGVFSASSLTRASCLIAAISIGCTNSSHESDTLASPPIPPLLIVEIRPDIVSTPPFVGDTIRLSVSTNRTQAFTVTWSTADTTIASVSTEGLLYARAAGTTHLRADLRFVDGGATGSGVVRVEVKPR